MGSRGTFDIRYGRTGGIPPEIRNYSLVGWLGNIKIIQCDVKKNNPTTTYSNTCNTTYFSYSKENKRIEHIYYFRNHKLIKSVDFKNGESPHAHYWNSGVIGRKSHNKNNIHPLSPKDMRLLNMAQGYNNLLYGK